MKKIIALLAATLFVATACININIGSDNTMPVDEVEKTEEEVEVIEEGTVNPLMEKFNLTEEELENLKETGLETEESIAAFLDELNAMGPGPFQINGDLEDVSGGSSSGNAGASYNDGRYHLYAKFVDLPNPPEGFFYEGWVVNKPFSVLSTGEVKRNYGEYINSFDSEEDLLDHTFYVLTIEPDDGDPAPADHILEGTMK